MHPVVLVTAGDPTGVGPEVMVRALADPSVHRVCRPVVVGDPGHVRRALEWTGLQSEVRLISSMPLATSERRIDVIGGPAVPESLLSPGPAAGRVVVDTLGVAVALLVRHDADALVTAPASKANIRASGFTAGIGQTAVIQGFAGVPDVVMLLAHQQVRAKNAPS